LQLVIGGVELGQRLALFHSRTFVDEDAFDAPGYLKSQLCGGHALDHAWKAQGLRAVIDSLQRLDEGHAWRHLRGMLVIGAAGEDQQGEQGCGEAEIR